mmetsp:Transcript_59103/g.183286  ORF Transcript_59103/g.183286 Transcript_59103/m.183286 type:complete len:447 (-) Transcript_59103:50-1390(-)
MWDSHLYSDQFFDGVEKAFEAAEREFFGADTPSGGATREKRRIREKVRKVGQSLQLPSGGVQGSLDEVVDRLVTQAFHRLGMATSRFADTVDWTLVLSSFVSEAWPHLGSQSEVSLVVSRAVHRWREANRCSTQCNPEEAPASQTQLRDSLPLSTLLAKGGVPADASSTALEGEDHPPVDEFEVVVHRTRSSVPLGAVLASLRVQSIKPQSLIDGRLLPGDRLVAVNGCPVGSQEQLLEALAGARTGPLRLRVLRERGPAPPAAPAGTQPPLPMPPPPLPPAAEDAAEEAAERLVVLNGEDIGREAAQCPAFEGDAFAWEGVSRAIAHYERLGLVVQCVCMQETRSRTPPPPDLAQKILACPVIDQDLRPASKHRRSDRIFTLRLAETYVCPWVDNSNYRASAWEDHSSWGWLQCVGAALKIGYVFDCFGQFVPSRNLASTGLYDQ